MPLWPSDAQADLPSKVKRADGKRVDRQARRLQSSIPVSGDPRTMGWRRLPPQGMYVIPAIVVSGITAASGTTPGSGTAQLYYLNTPDDTSATADLDNAAVTVLSWYTNSGTVGSGTHIFVVVWSNAYWLLTADC